ncbi:MAG: thermonuclease family protein [Candidatus Micrarchaeota archaeon]|nr:thermonuclease family protein [Candidatus Micrarchaeota archaeon]MCX8154743.1 thermonuclease family protein [Candidatus Micrarchaeota archaeon]
MREIILFVFIILISLLVLYLLSISGETRDVVEINNSTEFIDGDTVAIINRDVRVLYRDMLMDTPEIGVQKDRWRDMNGSCMLDIALRAREYLKRNLRNISLYGKTDRYGRELGIFLGEGSEPLAIQMVGEGLAFCYYRDLNARVEEGLRRYVEKCMKVEEEARRKNLGVWSCR